MRYPPGLLLMVWLLAQGTPAMAGDAKGTIVFFDPDANYEALPRAVNNLNAYFEEKLPDYKLQVTNEVDGMLQAIKASHAEYAIVGSAFASKMPAGANLVPVLVFESGGSVYYKKSLVDRGHGTAGDLRGKRVAAGVGDHTRGAATRIFAMLSEAGLKTDGAVFLGTAKDLDALLAVAFGQADAALVTAGSMATLKTISPSVANTMRTVWTSPDILRPVVVASRNGKDRDAVIKAFSNVAGTPSGQMAIHALGFDGCVPYSTVNAKQEATQ